MTRIVFAVLVAAFAMEAGAQESAAAAPAPAPEVQAPAAVPAPAPEAQPPAAAPAPAPEAQPLAAAPAVPTSLTSGSDGGWSVLARLGSYIPVVGEYAIYRPGVAIEAGIARQLPSVLSLEVSGLTMKAKTSIPVAATVSLGTGIATESELEMAGGLATLRATWAVGPVELNAGAGVGYYWVQKWETVLGTTFGGGFLSHDHPIGAHACAGVLVRVTPALNLSADLRYTYVEPFLFGHYERADGIGIAAGIGYRF